jgi:hypothetical protein
MELKINKTTYTLKNLNAERRAFFTNSVLSHYKTIHSKEVSDKERGAAVVEQSKSILELVWMFLFRSDKKGLRDKFLMKIEADDLVKFITTLNAKLKEYSNYINQTSQGVNKTEDSTEIYAFLSKEFGWTFEHIKEMDELELVKAIEKAIKLKKLSQANLINSNALVAAFGAGSKQAKRAIDNMNSDIRSDESLEAMKTQPAKRETELLTPDQLRRLASGRRG